jgi:single-strand selective monofunctional uracil DNA glycosylase
LNPKLLNAWAAMELVNLIDDLNRNLRGLKFGPPVTHVYNPLEYAREAYEIYCLQYGSEPKEVVLLGMNPGPWGMAQTGVPFGDAATVRDWLRIAVPVGRPSREHPKKPVAGPDCPRSEISGRRLWGWARSTFDTPANFFTRFFVANYCPLLFLEASGRNRTPDNLKAAEKAPLFEACDRALRRTIEWLRPQWVVGVGNFARDRARQALGGMGVKVGGILHPSPANPKANRGWEKIVRGELAALGIRV